MRCVESAVRTVRRGEREPRWGSQGGLCEGLPWTSGELWESVSGGVGDGPGGSGERNIPHDRGPDSRSTYRYQCSYQVPSSLRFEHSCWVRILKTGGGSAFERLRRRPRAKDLDGRRIFATF